LWISSDAAWAFMAALLGVDTAMLGIIAVAAVLTGAIIYLYFTNKKFHKEVDDFFNNIQSSWQPVALAFKAAFQPIIEAYNAMQLLIKAWQFWETKKKSVKSVIYSDPGVSGTTNPGKAFSGIHIPSKKSIEHFLFSWPGFAGGGTVAQTGTYMVGERGPELVRLNAGSQVVPNNQLGGAMTVTVPVYLDKRQIALATAEVTTDKEARL
jgi:hypothetical protein